MAENPKDKDKEKEGVNPEAGAEAAPPKKGKGKLLLLLLPVVGAVLGAAATMAIPRPVEGGKPVEHPPSHLEFTIPELKANLARTGGMHFVGADIVVQVTTKEPEDVKSRFGIKSSGGGEGGHGGGAPRTEAPPLQGTIATAVRDRVILLLNAKSIDDLEGRDKKELLKKEIKEELDPILFPQKDGEVSAVLFKDLLIQ